MGNGSHGEFSGESTPYTKTVSRLYKKNCAKQGQIYLIITAKDKLSKFTNYALVDAATVTGEVREQAFNILWEQLKTKYDL